MVGKYLETLVDFVARMLYYIDKYKLSFDKAFQYTLSDYRKRLRGYSLKRFYNISWNVILNYYKLRFIEEKVYGATKGYKRLVTLWMYYLGNDMLKEIKGYNRFIRKLSKSTPKSIDLDEELSKLDSVSRIAVELSYPKWFVELLLKYMNISEVTRLLESMNNEFYWIRVNTLKIDVDKAIRLLEAENVSVEQDKDLWYMLKVVDYSKPLYQLELLKEGYIITQDKASAMVVEALEPEENDVIIDMCAAPGIKASLIMQLTENKANMVLMDISRDRVYNMVKLLRKYGVDINRVQIVIADSTKPPISYRANKVLLDAPCTSSGTLPRDPSIRIHLDDIEWVKKFPKLQLSLLKSALKLGYEVVYAVCSLLPWEGEEVVEKIVRSENNIVLDRPSIPGGNGYKSYGISGEVVRFFPHIHRTEGFFIAKIKVL